MTIFVADKAFSQDRGCIYPEKALSLRLGYPSARDFEVLRTPNGRGNAVIARKRFAPMERMCRVSGLLVGRRRPHTVQVLPDIHMYDPHFAGLLLHSCNPNVFLDMSELWLWALTPIHAGDCLTMDHASTEQKLYRQFACRCGSSNCHGWITGYDEPPNEQGMKFLKHWRRRCHRD
ncbi:lysine methyltransferase [Pseudomonas corrugata]|uniref:Lysine methyltransferase n=1 Tax=Pseudomonas corrugata TaxID=47879 RepID=A0A7Y5Z8L0_9PSED|nr:MULTISPECIES: lysine methyltransferase [Pseudomonas]MCI0993564.1 lysine methyltransferase [Pseudomonas corrugata]NUT69250.1 lysine methyltransferase [Pseudomonas corrugata]NUT88884.1 lysine methyltransferase [Pseudomonas corrugata]TNF82780.1 lysine methyltransferase [Pseudomonas sp. ICMP22404]